MSEIELIFQSRLINADLLFLKNFLKLNNAFLKTLLKFVVEDIGNAFSEAGVLMNNAGILAGTLINTFFKNCTNGESKTAWNEFKSEKHVYYAFASWHQLMMNHLSQFYNMKSNSGCTSLCH